MAEERMPVLDRLCKGEEVPEDPLREIVRWTIQELMEAEVSAQIGAGALRAQRRAGDAAQWVSVAPLGYAGGHPGAAEPEAADGELLPELAGAAAAGRAGTGGSDRRGVCAGREHA